MSKGSKRRPIAQHAKATYDANHPFPVPNPKPCTNPACKGWKQSRIVKGICYCTRCGRAV